MYVMVCILAVKQEKREAGSVKRKNDFGVSAGLNLAICETLGLTSTGYDQFKLVLTSSHQ